MKITLVRHGQMEYNYQKIMQGHSNTELNDTGIRQCQKLREQLADVDFDYCYMSPILRAVQTAFILVGDRVETIPDKRLIERDMGEFTGKSTELYDREKYWDYDLNCSDNGVEAIQDVFSRCCDFLNYIVKKHPGEHILVVSHAATIRALHHLLHHHNLHSDLLRKVVCNCYVEEVEVKEGTVYESL